METCGVLYVERNYVEVRISKIFDKKSKQEGRDFAISGNFLCAKRQGDLLSNNFRLFKGMHILEKSVKSLDNIFLFCLI